MRLARPSSPSGAYASVAGLLVAATGVAVVLGSLGALPGVVSDVASRSLSAGIALAATGAGCVLATRGARGRSLAAALGLGACVLGLVALWGYGFSLPRILLEWTAFADPSHDSMSPNLALASVLAGAALLALVRLPPLASLCGALCAALGAAAVLGHLFGIAPAYAWQQSAPMPPATAACLLLLGSALTVHPVARSASGWVQPWQAPVLFGLVTAAVSLLLAQALVSYEREQLDRLVSAGARRVRAELREHLNQRMEVLSVLAREWQDRVFATRNAWEADVRLLFSRAPGLVAVEWLGAQGEPGWIHPRDVELPALPVEDGASLHGRLAGPLPLPGGTNGLRLLAPLTESRRVEGWLAGTFDTQVLFEEMLSGLEAQWIVRLEAGGVELFRNAGLPAEAAPPSRRVALDVRGVDLFAVVEPTREMIRSVRSRLPLTILAAGLMTALLLTLALGLRNLAAARAAALREEARERERAHDALRRLYAELEHRVQARTAELSQRNHDLRRFASFVSHELQQPVSTLSIWAELLESRHGTTLAPEASQYVAEIRASARRLGDQIAAQLLAASAEPSRQPTDLVRTVRGVVGSLKPALEAAEASLEMDPLPPLHVDPDQIERLFFNLLENAIKYRRHGAPLEIRIRYVGGDPIEIRVEDNGKGFRPEDAERLFALGERLGHPNVDGHGLGLAICRRIVERHGGSLEAEGNPERGASFRIRFPAELAAASETAPR